MVSRGRELRERDMIIITLSTTTTLHTERRNLARKDHDDDGKNKS